jgi:hypothetical protein
VDTWRVLCAAPWSEVERKSSPSFIREFWGCAGAPHATRWSVRRRQRSYGSKKCGGWESSSRDWCMRWIDVWYLRGSWRIRMRWRRKSNNRCKFSRNPSSKLRPNNSSSNHRHSNLPPSTPNSKNTSTPTPRNPASKSPPPTQNLTAGWTTSNASGLICSPRSRIISR